MRWRFLRGLFRSERRTDDELRALAEEMAGRFIAACDPSHASAAAVLTPIIEEICVRERLSGDDLDRMVTHFGAVADELIALQLESAVPAGHA